MAVRDPMDSGPIKLILPGRIVEPTAADPGVDQYVDVETLREQAVETTVRGVSGEEQELDGARDTDVVELEWEGGVKQWVSVAQLREDMDATGLRRDGGPQQLRVPARLVRPNRTRGVADWVLKGLKVLRISPAEAVASLAADQIVAHFEEKLQPGPGLYRFTDPNTLGERIASPGDLDASAPYLVFIHGTASSSSGSFSGLSGQPEWEALRGRYGDRILALQHRTMSVRPFQNALDLAELLPARAKLHLVSHSRGGLVGEFLCIRPLADEDLRPFERSDRELLARLSATLDAKQFDVERFVRVACPARGTLLASNRLDLYLSVILNVIGHIPALVENPIYAFAKATLLELAKRRAEPKQLPGIESQMPESAVIHLLNRPGVSVKADLAVIAGDVQGEGFWGRLKAFATDLYYREDHDLVVNTEAMYGGLGREKGAYFFFDQGSDVNHFSYFRNAKTRERLLGWLTQPAGDPTDTTFTKISREAVNPLTVTRSRGRADQLPVLFLLPSTMATGLDDPKGKVWLDFAALSLGGMDRLDVSRDQVRPGDLIGSGYQQIVEALQSKYEVVPFPYDWRRSAFDEAARLTEAVERELSSHQRPVRFLAHSSGGLVVRAMIAADSKRWECVAKRGGRLVMLGTPNQGTYTAFRLLVGREKLVRLLGLLGFDSSNDGSGASLGITDVLRKLPGIVEQLPEDADYDLFSSAAWKDLGLARRAPAAKDLKEAKSARARLDEAVDAAHMVYVAGSAPVTPDGIFNDSGEEDGLVFSTTALGDGRVSYERGRLDKVPTYFMDAAHGDLANHPPSFPALVELLETGKTNKLAMDAPKRAKSAAGERTLRDDEPLLFPTEQELVAAALGTGTAHAELPQSFPLKVSVSHGHLKRASYPIAVGHYYGDTIVSAEAVIDRQLDGRLSERFRMDMYPGPIGTTEIIRPRDTAPPGAIVIGLGEIGALTPQKLRRGVMEAALRYALLVADDAQAEGLPTWRSAAFSTLLLGTQSAGTFGTDTCVISIVEGVIEANRTLRAQGLWDRVRIDALEFVELYENVAVEALHAAVRFDSRLPAYLEEEGGIDVVPYLRVLDGGRFQQPTGLYASGWWKRLQITVADRCGASDDAKGDEDRDLQFVALTSRARAEETLQSTQRKLIDRYIADMIRSPEYREDAASTLFELLLPNSVKDQARDEADLVLVLDSTAAQYPWELLAERTRRGVSRLALERGIIRQFRTQSFRARPQSPRDRNALVVGDTINSFAPLPGAQREGEEVAKVLKGAGFAVSSLVKANGLEIVNELFAREYRVLHLATHGIYNPDHPKQSGVVLSDGMYLTAAELCQLRVIPEVVFLNCCHLGRIDKEPTLVTESPNRLAASVSQALIEAGVKAIVAAGWAVDDQAASTFATTFYGEMLSGSKFGDAVRRARVVAAEQHPNTNTWGAYQCYGNPDFVLSGVSGSWSRSGTAERYLARREYLDQLQNVSSAAQDASKSDVDGLRSWLEGLETSISAQWRDGEVLAGFGSAWAKLGVFERAIAAYREAITAEQATAPIVAVEQLANLLVRYAEQRRAAEDEGPDPNDLVGEAGSLFDWLLKLGETPERLSFVGGRYKRLAHVADGRARRAMLERARDLYGKAHANAVAKGGAPEPYATLDWIACRVLLRDANREELLGLLDQCERQAARNERRTPSFRNRIVAPDAALLRHILDEDLATNRERVVRLYRRAVEADAAPDDVASARDRLAFLLDILVSQKRPETRADVLDALRLIQESL